jgi:hypothetical protein
MACMARPRAASRLARLGLRVDRVDIDRGIER